MKKISQGVHSYIHSLEGYNDEIRYKERATKVRQMWADIMEDIFLEHTNAVYIIKKDDLKTLIVYVDESMFSAELNARRELIKLQFLQRFNEDIDEFKICISRGDYKKNHPFMKEPDPSFIERAHPQPISVEQKEMLEEKLSCIQDDVLRSALRKAAISDFEWKNGINDKNRK